MQQGMQMAEMVTLQVPQGMGPGMAMPVQFQSGNMIQVMIPQGFMPGMLVTVDSMGNVMPAQQMQQPMGGMQHPMGGMQPPMQQPMQSVDAWQILNAMPNCELQEELRWGEVLTAAIGIEVDFANRYKVLDPNGVEVLLFAEQTDFCKRQMKRGPCADCIGWDVDGLNIYGGANQPFLKLTRPFTFTLCCFNRPVMEIADIQTGNVIGSMRDPWACCDLTFQVRGPDGQDVLYAKGGCCQWGLCVQCPCGPCAEVNFEIEDAKTGQKVGHIQKKVPSCIKCCLDGDISNYKVDFSGVENPQWKAMLMALAVFIDFRYFSTTQDPSEIGSTGLLGAAMGGGDVGGGGFEDFGGGDE